MRYLPTWQSYDAMSGRWNLLGLGISIFSFGTPLTRVPYSVCRQTYDARFTTGNAMANEQQRSMLWSGVDKWNAWRQARPRTKVDVFAEEEKR